jgi:hypothetical protein
MARPLDARPRSPRLLHISLPLLTFLGILVGQANGAERAPALGRATITQEMLKHAAEVGARLSERKEVEKAQKLSFRRDLTEECDGGSLDACFILAESMPSPLLPGSSRSPEAAYAAETTRADALEKLCRQKHPAACLSLGLTTWFRYIDSRRKPSRPLVEIVRSATTFAPPADRQRLTRSAGRPISWAAGFDIPDADLRRYSRACANHQGWACFAGELNRWTPHGDVNDPKVVAAYQEMIVRKGRVAAEVQAKTYARYCPKYPTLCESAVNYGSMAAPTSLEEEIKKYEDLCAVDDAAACYFAGNKKSYLEDGTDRWGTYERACELGFMGGCMELAEHLLALGEPQKALGYAVTACQKDWGGGCSVVVKKFGLSSEFVAPSTGKFVVNYACDREDEGGCMDSYRLDFKEHRWNDARRGFGRYCEINKNFAACRFAAQVAWSNGQPEDAIALLEKGCLSEDLDSCLEKAGAYAAKGDSSSALRILDSYCEKAGPNANVYSCNLARGLRKGFRPGRLNEIFKEPLDGSKNPVLEASD